VQLTRENTIERKVNKTEDRNIRGLLARNLLSKTSRSGPSPVIKGGTAAALGGAFKKEAVRHTRTSFGWGGGEEGVGITL